MLLFEKDKRYALAISTVILYASYKLFRVLSGTAKSQPSKDIPVPGPSYFYIGHMLSMGRIPGKTVEKWHKKLGPIIKLYMGAQTWIMVADPVLAHKIFVTNSAKTSFRPSSHFSHLYSKGGKGIAFSQPSDTKWKTTRSKMQAVLLPKRIETYTPSINLEAQELVDQLIEQSEKQNGIYSLEHFKWFAINTVFLLGFAKRFERVDHPEFIKFSHIIKMTSDQLEPVKDLGEFLPGFSFLDAFISRKSEGKQFIETVRDPIFLKYINEALDSDKPSIVKSIKESGADWAEDEYIAFIADLLSAGTDTIGATLLWNLTLMCHYPNCQKTASDEVDQFIRLNGRLPQFSERTQLPYTISVMKECLRFKPTMPFGLPHAVQEEIEVDGYVFPKGCTIFSSMHAMHSGSYYEQADLFLPERYLNDLNSMYALQRGKLDERDQFNFGWGRRGCPGVYLAEAEMFLAIVQILGRCFIEPPTDGMPGIDEAENAGLNLQPPRCKLRFIKRHDSLI